MYLATRMRLAFAQVCILSPKTHHPDNRSNHLQLLLCVTTPDSISCFERLGVVLAAKYAHATLHSTILHSEESNHDTLERLDGTTAWRANKSCCVFACMPLRSQWRKSIDT
jgi:hypothetical protein